MAYRIFSHEIARYPYGAILLGNDVGPLASVEECPEAEGMVEMAMRIDDGVQRGHTPGAHRRVDRLTVVHEAWVDEQEARLRL
jgi:hypothetical protein